MSIIIYVFFHISYYRYTLKLGWNWLHQTTHLSVAFAVTVIVREVFVSLEGQLEKRSYGADNLVGRRCDNEWTLLAAKLRVSMILQSRWSTSLWISAQLPTDYVTVNGVERGQINIYTILANDTLSFSIPPDQVILIEVVMIVESENEYILMMSVFM